MNKRKRSGDTASRRSGYRSLATAPSGVTSAGTKLPNGYTVGFAREWDRACRYAARICDKEFGKAWHDDSIAGEYMALRNGYLAGHRAGRRALRRRYR